MVVNNVYIEEAINLVANGASIDEEVANLLEVNFPQFSALELMRTPGVHKDFTTSVYRLTKLPAYHPIIVRLVNLITRERNIYSKMTTEKAGIRTTQLDYLLYLFKKDERIEGDLTNLYRRIARHKADTPSGRVTAVDKMKLHALDTLVQIIEGDRVVRKMLKDSGVLNAGID